MARASNQREAAFWIVAALFLASGFSSLIYQVVWTRMLNLILDLKAKEALTHNSAGKH